MGFIAWVCGLQGNWIPHPASVRGTDIVHFVADLQEIQVENFVERVHATVLDLTGSDQCRREPAASLAVVLHQAYACRQQWDAC